MIGDCGNTVSFLLCLNFYDNVRVIYMRIYRKLIIKYYIKGEIIMKNFVLFIMMFVAICVTGSRIIGEINQKHEEEVDNLVKTYESQIEELKNENSEINEELTELYDNIYNRENGKPYYIRIEHDGYIHTYEGDNKFLGRGSHSVMKFY